jgi:Family of unknown function (DUF6502)
MPTRSAIILQTTLGLLKPLVRLLLRHGVAYPAFAAALKKVFLEAAQAELRQAGHATSDSAVSLLSGVHRRDVRNLTRYAAVPDPATQASAKQAPMNMATQVVARWLSQAHYLDAQGNARPLARVEPGGGFDALVTSVSTDIRPRAVLDELVRLGIATEIEGAVQLLDTAGLAPRQGFAEMAILLEANVHDHLAAASANLEGGSNFLEQSIFVDQITVQSAQRLHAVSAKAWRQAFKTVMQEAAERFDHDQAHAQPQDRTHRARFGAYFYTQQEDKNAQDAPPA